MSVNYPLKRGVSMRWNNIEVLARHEFATYEDWWRWDSERLKAGYGVVITSECDDCDQITIEDLG